MSLGSAFVAALGPERAAEARALGHLDETLGELVRRAKEAWPELELAPERFLAHVAARLAPGPEPLDAALAGLRGADLYLACACAEGRSEALRAFEQRFFPDIEPALVRIARDRSLKDEVAQLLRHKLFVGDSAPPKIAEYAGRGELRSWFRAAVVRTTLNLVTRALPRADGDSDLGELPADAADPEVQHLTTLYQAEFKAAFAEAAARLTPRDRNLLRYGFSEGLGIDEIGAVYGVHRATAARWLAKAREELAAGVRRQLVARLRVDDRDYESILRLVRSHLEITAERYFRSAEGS